MNILDSLKSLVTDELLTETADAVGEEHTAVASTLHLAIPTVLAGLLNAAPQKYKDVEQLMKSADTHDTSIVNLLDKGVKAHSMDGYFKSFHQAIFGEKTKRVVHILENTGQASEDAVPSILRIASSIVATFLGKKMTVEKSSFASILNWIGKDKAQILAAAPHDIQNALGMSAGGWNEIDENATTENTVPVAASVGQPNKEYDATLATEAASQRIDNKKMQWLWPLLLLAALAAGLIWLLNKNGCNNENNVDTTEVVEPQPTADTVQISQSITIMDGSLDEDGNWIAAKGDTINLKLEDGTELLTTKGSVTDKLYNFLREPEVNADKDNPENWFDFDDILFQTGSSKLKPGAENQIKNVIAVLKAFPLATIKLGGYTDTTGSEEANVKISGQRAKTVYNKMISMGADKISFDAEPYEGYGSQFPACAANDTPECMAQNRRIALVVTSK